MSYQVYVHINFLNIIIIYMIKASFYQSKNTKVNKVTYKLS